ncbi:YihY/virulence factor BrkB family protein [Romboutsia weinsteinii]|uniref:YihY/virulence factor BrkB family protein n=1 Tax=Romboutsia weinsteinii TaxID=2020949 RepID=A0A371J6S8_9FIRM|nr:YihY/virulence factor BrkB family protein [Romboutsia weinsteinii]RDY28393.1 YihY/virulence factor BrkB family protein [Romboutsia weinsteinii]
MIICKDTILKIIRNSYYSDINSKAAEISFYLILSLFPFLMFTISTIVYIPVIHLNKYILLLQNIIPPSAFELIYSIINSARDNRSLSFIIMSFILTMWTSSRAVVALIKATNRAYRMKESRSYIKRLRIALIFTLILLLLIFSSMIFLVYGEKLGYFIFNLIGLDNIFMKIWNICRYTGGITTVIIIFVSLYVYTPNKKIMMKEALPGAIVSTFGWLIVSFGYSYYTNYYARYDVIYGSIGGIIVLMTWMYLSSWAMLIGLEVNARIYLRRSLK